MIDMLLLAIAAKAGGDYEPPPELWYRQAVSCAASLKLTVKKEPTSAQFADMMTWGMIMADTGRKIGRTKEQVDSGDLRIAEGFYRHLQQKKPKAFAAHRAYCQALFDADRP
ncbi:MAG TPA: hypothetical protein VFQ67_08350 [Allosphingosinicella sp.]|jgi:hypothetical protein|nr:hypothetical protein [Allosphingosinicella sp.]